MKLPLIYFAILACIQFSTYDAAILTCKLALPPCTPHNITAVTTADETISIFGQPTSYVDNTTTSLAFQQPSQLKFVPSDLFRTFTNLASISLANVSLTNLVPNAFKNCGKLFSISIVANNISSLPAAFAPTCTNVTSLQLPSNRIKSVDSDAFEGLTFLTFLSLMGNNLTCIPPGLFGHTPIIQTIDLSNNQISEIAPSVFRGLANLMSLNLNDNRIVNLPAFDFKNTGLVTSLNINLNNNQFKNIDPAFITNVFTTRVGSMSMVYVMLYSYDLKASCITNPAYSSLFSHNWPIANISISACYANWKDEYATEAVSCAKPGSFETTTKKSEGGRWPFGGDSSLFAILSNTKKNFTADVSFY